MTALHVGKGKLDHAEVLESGGRKKKDLLLGRGKELEKEKWESIQGSRVSGLAGREKKKKEIISVT